MILVCEPNCVGFEHAEVNAALIAAIRGAYPAEPITFAAETGQIGQVRARLEQHGIKEVVFQELSVQPRRRREILRLLPDLFLFYRFFAAASRTGSDRLLFCSILSPGLIAIKILMLFFRKIKVYLIPHNVLAQINGPPKRWYFIWPLILWFRPVMALMNSNRLRYLVLGEPIKKQLCLALPGVEKHLSVLDLPYFFVVPGDVREGGEKIVFGALGSGNLEKGIDLFFRAAAEVDGQTTRQKGKFTLIGHLAENKIRQVDRSKVVITSPDRPLAWEEYKKQAEGIDYAVFLYDQQAYRFRISAALFDAFSFGKPIIALRSQFFDHYFDLLGDIGYLCDSYDELKKTLIDILNNDSSDRYRKQRENIIKGRQKIGIGHVAEQFKVAWEQQ
ncbi:MAG: hypothetical protein ABIH56_07995 [Candidatus Margulisiibacteriota bacterium]